MKVTCLLAGSLVCLTWCGTVVGCAGPVRNQPIVLSAKPPAPDDAVDDRHEFAITDVIAVKFPRRPDFDQEVVVRNDGQIMLPLVGTVMAARRTPEELEADLRDRYATLSYSPLTGPRNKAYLINIDDVLEIRFRDATPLNQTVQVRPDGRISLSLVKSVVAEGKTPETLEAELIQRYGTELVNPDLVVIVQKHEGEFVSVDGKLVSPGIRGLEDPAVIVRSSAPRQVYVTGEVRTPGFVAFRPALTAVQAIITSGGLLNTAAGDRIVLLRKTGQTAPTATFLDLKADLEGKADNDVPLRPFDIVVVPKTRIASVNQFMDQYVYQLVPAARNVNFTFFYEISGTTIPPVNR